MRLNSTCFHPTDSSTAHSHRHIKLAALEPITVCRSARSLVVIDSLQSRQAYSQANGGVRNGGWPITNMPCQSLTTNPQSINNNRLDLASQNQAAWRGIHHAFTGTGSIALACAAQVWAKWSGQTGPPPRTKRDESGPARFFFWSAGFGTVVVACHHT